MAQISLDAKLDNTDIAIIKSLIQDGRKSFRQIAREIKASTPTVEARFSRMKGLGIIKSIQPVFDIEKIDNQMSALIFIKTNLSHSTDIANKLASIGQVCGVYKMTGEYNIIVKVIMAQHPEYLEEFIRTKIANIEGIKSASYQMITKTIKDNQSIPVIKEGIFLKIKCDYCDNDIFKDTKTPLHNPADVTSISTATISICDKRRRVQIWVTNMGITQYQCRTKTYKMHGAYEKEIS